MNKLVEEIIKPILEANSNITKVIGVYGGRFQPFGPHHYKTYKWLTKQVDEAYISTSNIKKPPRHPMNFKEKVRHMSKMGVPANRIIEEKSPYVANNLAKKFNKDTTAFVYVFGAKDAGRLGGSGKYFQDFKKNKNNLKGYKEHGYYLVAPHVSMRVGGKEVSGTTMRELLGSNIFDEKKRVDLFKKMFGYYDRGVYNMMTNKFKKLFESIDSEDMIWEPTEPKKPVKKVKDKKILKSQNEDSIGGGYPNKEDMIKIKKRVNKARSNSDSNQDYQYHPVQEAINLPVEIGDTILMGKFKNKRVVIKSIDFNDKGDLLINGRPALKFRMIKEFFENLNMKNIIKEATTTYTSGGAAVDDGHTFGFGDIDNYANINDIQARKLGFKIVDFIMKTPTDYEPDTPVYANDGAVSYAPAGIGTGRTPNNQVDLTGDAVWLKWEKYIDKIATTSGMKFMDYLLDKDIIKQASKDTKDMVKTRNQENPPETPERKYVEESFTKEWWKENLFEINISSDKLLSVAKYLTKKYRVNVNIKIVPKLKNDEYAFFDFDKKTMFISKKASKDLNQFLISVLHEIDHAKDLQRYGKKFILDYEKQQNMIAQGFVKGKKDPYWDNPYEIKAEKFGRKEAKKYSIKKLFGESITERKYSSDYGKAYVKTIPYDDETAGYETGEYFENPYTQERMPGLFADEDEMIRRIQGAPEIELSDNELSNMDNTDYWEIKKQKRRDRIKRAKQLAKQYGKNWKGISADIKSGDPRQAPIAIRDADGKLHLLAGNTRLMTTTAYGKKIPIKVIDYKRKFKKEKTEESINENLLLEGGAYGHMAHPFDDKDLTFGDLKKIIELGLGGQLSREDNVTEKLDGQNIMISWKDGKLIAARNKGHIKNGGKTALDTRGIMSKFKGRGDIRNAFVYAMKDLEKAIKKLSQKQKDKIFNNGYNFMNMEVMWPKSANVIDYDKAELVFHGALKYDDAGNVKGEVPNSGRILSGMIEQVNQHIQKKYKIAKPVFLDVPKHQDFSKMKGKFLSRLNKLQAQYGLKDNDTLALYHQMWWEVFISNNWPKKLSTKVVEGLTKRWAFFDKSYSVADIKKDMKMTDFFDEKALQSILDFDKKNHAAQVKKNMKPFETLFFEVGAEILKNVKGFMAANPSKAVQGIRKRLDAAIKNVRSGGDIKKLKTLKLQLEKLKSIGGTKAIVPSEGIVFKYKGKTYKFTGAFAPINQITGLISF